MKKSAIILLHIGYWALYILLIVTFLMAMANSTKHQSFSVLGQLFFSSPLGIVTLLPSAFGFYTFYSILFSRFLNQRKLISLSAWGLLTVISCGALPILILSFPFKNGWGVTEDWFERIAMIIFLAMLALINGIIGLVMKGFITWYGDIRLKEELKRKNYEIELALIKSQINPHFLFNTLNNIDVLIEKDAVKASAYLNKLSDIMRFMLYETKSDQIPLSKELAYIEKYIELQRIRTSAQNYINYIVGGDFGNIMIEPLLFIPFIENAFKYAEHKKLTDAVKIQFDIKQHRIGFYCENLFSQTGKIKPEESGLGNELIQKRLNLLYPGKHELTVSQEGGYYKVSLILSLNEN
ncbi:MAG: sensor histidine kinase [Chitinophagaceae bacterium]